MRMENKENLILTRIRSFFRQYEDLWLKVQKEHQQAQKPVTVSCAAGCSACCHEPVYVTNGEVKLIVASMKPGELEILRAKVCAWLDQVDKAGLVTHLDPSHPIQALDYRAHHIPCPLLRNNLCSVYDVRPVACRYFMAIGRPENCSDLKLRPRQQFLQCQGLYEWANHELILAHAEAGYDEMAVSHLGYMLAVELGLIQA